jgi:hypothetical protein
VADPVIFDRSSAERIASAVRRVEIGDRSESPLRFDTVPPPQQRKTFRIATFSGAWAINATKTVTFKYQTTTPNTASVLNLFFPYPAVTSVTDCAIAKDGTAWHLIDVPFATATAVFASAAASQTVVSNVTVQNAFVATTARLTYLQSISVAASLNTNNCNITVTKNEVTGASSIVTGGVVSSTVNRTTSSINVVSGTYTAVFVRFGVA